MISQRNYVHQPTQNKSRKTRDGDWICIKCSNYNYAFRDICNRCHLQNKKHNEQQMQAIGKQNYGQNSFPSVVFVNMNNQQMQRNNQNYNNSNIQQVNSQQSYHNNQQIYQNSYVSNNQSQTYCNYNYQYNNYYQNNQYQFYSQQQQFYKYNMYPNNNNGQKQIYSHRRVISMPLEENLFCFNSSEQEQEEIDKDQLVIDQLNSLLPENIWISSLIDE